MKNIIKSFILFFIVSASLTINAQDPNKEYFKEQLFGKWELKEIIKGETLKICEEGENITYIFHENEMTVFEVSTKTGCQNGIVNKYDYEFDGLFISLYDGNLKFKIIELTDEKLILESQGESELYEKIE